MEQIENRMVVDSEWGNIEEHYVQELCLEPGYIELDSGHFVSEQEAYNFALDRCLHGTEKEKTEFCTMLTEWFYSGGDWRKR